MSEPRMSDTIRTEQYFLMDQVAGWRAAACGIRHLTLAQEGGDLMLDALPGNARPLLGGEGKQPAFVCPGALALSRGNCGGQDAVLVADAATNFVGRISLPAGRPERINAIGGEGRQPRRLKQPRGLAVTPSGAIVVADAANHRVQVFSPAPYALLQVWGARDAQGRPAAGKGRREFSWPCAVAVDDCGDIYVADRGNHRVQKFNRNGDWLEEIGACYLRWPVRLAIGPRRELAVADRKQRAVFVVEPGRPLPRTLMGAGDVCGVTFDDLGNLYAGDGAGLIRVFAPDSASPSGYRLMGEGDTGIVGEIVDLVWHRDEGLIAIINEPDNEQPRWLWRVPTDGGFATQGSMITTALDSRIERCQWHRILLKARVPSHTSIQVDSFTSEERVEDARIRAGSLPWRRCALSGDDDPECLVQSGPGRYLWLRLTFGSDGLASPRLHRAQVFFPRQSYLQYLPAVYQEDRESKEFLERFLAIFQTGFDRFDQQIDDLWQLFDPAAAGEQYLHWLAGWLALAPDPHWTTEKMRGMIKTAFQSYLRRGTADGIEQAIIDYAGADFARVVEHYRLRRWPALNHTSPLDGGAELWGRDVYRRLQVGVHSQIGRFQLTSQPEPAIEQFAQAAHKFTVFFPADPYRVEEAEKRVRRVVEREKPAHTEAALCPVLPRMRVGVQARLGFDSVVGGVSNLVLGRLATLNYDSVLACSEQERQLRALGASMRPRAGLNARLL